MVAKPERVPVGRHLDALVEEKVFGNKVYWGGRPHPKMAAFPEEARVAWAREQVKREASRPVVEQARLSL